MAKRTPSTPSGGSATPGTPRKRTTTKKANGGATTAPGAPVAPAEPSDEDVRVRAYHRYLERGGRHGADFDDWVEAEKDLKRPRS
jgi:Protein of unknown function (DUF2934)